MKSTYSCLMVACLIGMVGHAPAQTPAGVSGGSVVAADQLLRDGDFEAAAAAYQQLDDSDLPLAAIYNHGIALYRLGKIGEAAAQFQRAAVAPDSSLASRARFNLGNTHYAQALSIVQSAQQPDPSAAIEHLKSAIDSYRSALRVDSTDADARANIELANQLIQQQQDQQQQDQQQQSDSSSQPEQDNNESDSTEEQQDRSQPTESQSRSDGQQQQDGQENPDADPNAGESDSPSQEDEPADSDQPQEQPQSDGQDSSSMPPQSRDGESDSKSKPSQADDSERPADLEEDEQQPDDQPQDTSSGELTAANQDDEEAKGDSEVTVAPESSMQMTEQEARKMLQAIRDRDLLRRLQRQAEQRRRRVPVDRDW